MLLRTGILIGFLVNNNRPPPSPVFLKVLILKGLKVLCFDTLLKVFILKVLRRAFITRFSSADSKGLTGRELGDGKIES